MTNRLDRPSPQAQQFLETVRGHLDDLPVADQADLLEPIELRLSDLDTNGDGRAIEATGRPALLAADLRAAAGFPPASASPSERRPPSSLDIVRQLLNHAGVRPIVNYLASLRPAWWAARGYILVAGALAVMSHGGGYRLHTIGSYRAAFGNDDASLHLSRTWILIPLAAIVGSVALGMATMRLARWARLAVTALNVVAVILFAAYPTWWLAPAFGYYAGLVT